jgi:hypothetical protein
MTCEQCKPEQLCDFCQDQKEQDRIWDTMTYEERKRHVECQESENQVNEEVNEDE